MKNLLIILCILSIFFLGCKKDSSENQNNNIQGTWSLKSLKAEYYTSSGNMDFEENMTGSDFIGSDLYREISFNTNSCKIIYYDNEIENYNYSLTKANNKIYLTFTNPIDLSDSYTMEISSLVATSMDWLSKDTNVRYEKNNTSYRAAKVQYKFHFIKK